MPHSIFDVFEHRAPLVQPYHAQGYFDRNILLRAKHSHDEDYKEQSQGTSTPRIARIDYVLNIDENNLHMA